MTRQALITGISGQDGSCLAEYLLDRGYRVYGLVRREPQTVRWLHALLDRVELLYGDLRDEASLAVAFHKAWPDELYNLAGQVFVPTSWQIPAETIPPSSGRVRSGRCGRRPHWPGSSSAGSRRSILRAWFG